MLLNSAIFEYLRWANEQLVNCSLAHRVFYSMSFIPTGRDIIHFPPCGRLYVTTMAATISFHLTCSHAIWSDTPPSKVESSSLLSDLGQSLWQVCNQQNVQKRCCVVFEARSVKALQILPGSPGTLPLRAPPSSLLPLGTQMPLCAERKSDREATCKGSGWQGQLPSL